MNHEPTVRTLPTDMVRQLWALIAKMEKSLETRTLANIAYKAEKTFGWSPTETKAYLSECSDSGLLLRLPEKSQNGGEYCLPTEFPDEVDNDWYCYECHTPGKLLNCTACFRSFHSDCLPVEVFRSQSNIVCPYCQASMREIHRDIMTLNNVISPSLTSLATKYGNQLMYIPVAGGCITQLQFNLLAVRPVDLSTITKRLNSGQYNNLLECVHDFCTMLHNVIVVYGKSSAIAKAAHSAYQEIREAYVVWKEMSNNERPKDEMMMIGGLMMTSSTESGNSTGQRTMDKMLCESREGMELQEANPSDMEDDDEEYCGCTARYKQYFSDMRDQFIMMFNDDVEKCKTELREKIRKKFVTEQNQVRSEMMTEFKRELENTREELNIRYANQLKFELQKLSDRHKKQLDEMKKKQWCYQCEAEAIYYCCWNTSYCSVECQQEHWPSHRATCRRKKT